MALSPAEMQEAIIKNLPKKTGKSLEEWIEIARDFKLTKNSEITKKLKADYGLGHVQAQTIVRRMDGKIPYVQTDGYEEAIFKNTFQLYEELKKQITSLSNDVKVKPCKTYIPFYRNKQFAIATEKKGELILGLNLSNEAFPELTDVKKLGGSDRINKMLVVQKDNIQDVLPYVQEAFQNN